MILPKKCFINSRKQTAINIRVVFNC